MTEPVTELEAYRRALTEVATTFPPEHAGAIIRHHTLCVPGTHWTKPANATPAELHRATTRFREQAANIRAGRPA